MTLYTIDPLTDSRWTSFLERHAEATIFHTPGWLRALQRTYGYEPVVYSTSRPDEELTNGMVFCEVNSWLTGRRLVSLPFSDHCQPLLSRPEELWVLLNALAERRERERWRYIEIRPLHSAPAPIKEHTRFGESEEFCLHKVDLTPLLSEVYRRFHESSVQRKLCKAQRANLSYEEGRSAVLLEKFYHLLVMTRRRHLVPPQPIEWFRNLIECLGEQVKIHIVSQNDQPLASEVTLLYKSIVVSKYSCSNLKYQ
jgi:hypothetical protein